MKPIKEENLEIGFLNALNQLTARKNDIMTRLKSNIETTISKPGVQSILDLKTRLKDNQSKLLELNKKAVMQGDAKGFENEAQNLVEEIHDIQEQLNTIKEKQDTINIIDYRIREISKVLKNVYTEFNKDVFRTLIDKVIIKDKHQATYIFKCGIAVDQEI